MNYITKVTYNKVNKNIGNIMKTERYLVSFPELIPEYNTKEYIANIWDVSAIRIFEETGLYITGEIQERYLIDNKMDNDSLNMKTIFVIESQRNPLVTEDKDEYWYIYKYLIEQVRFKLGNPKMDLTIEDIDTTHFEKI